VLRPFQEVEAGSLLDILFIRHSANPHEGLSGYHLVCPDRIITLEEARDESVLSSLHDFFEDLGPFDTADAQARFRRFQADEAKRRDERLRMEREELRQKYSDERRQKAE
jgi:hypothetical protein